MACADWRMVTAGRPLPQHVVPVAALENTPRLQCSRRSRHILRPTAMRPTRSLPRVVIWRRISQDIQRLREQLTSTRLTWRGQPAHRRLGGWAPPPCELLSPPRRHRH
uniref:Uncharacterized protein n=1 Tax=Arundo donax TaxID=35708 RepID=A0A0A8XWV4_ARUDO